MGAFSSLMLVGLGGALGAMARYFVGVQVANRTTGHWPYGTFIINITGCLFISFFLTFAAGRLGAGSGWRFFFPTGFVGAYTTFSTFEYETLRLLELRAWRSAISYVLLSTLVGFGGVVLAAWLARR